MIYSNLRLERMAKKTHMIFDLQKLLYDIFEKKCILTGPMMGNNPMKDFIFFTGTDFNQYKYYHEAFVSRKNPIVLPEESRYFLFSFRGYYGESYSSFRKKLIEYGESDKI